MYGSLGNREPPEGVQRLLCGPLRQAGALDHGPNVPEVSVGVLLGVLDRDPQGADAVDLDRLGAQVEGHAQAA